MRRMEKYARKQQQKEGEARADPRQIDASEANEVGEHKLHIIFVNKAQERKEERPPKLELSTDPRDHKPQGLELQGVNTQEEANPTPRGGRNEHINGGKKISYLSYFSSLEANVITHQNFIQNPLILHQELKNDAISLLQSSNPNIPLLSLNTCPLLKKPTTIF